MIAKIFLKGLAAILPVAITIALLVWFFSLIEGTVGFVIKKLIGPEYYFPGLGLIIGLIAVFLIGFAMNAWIGQKLYKLTDKLFKRIPLVKALYGAITELLKFFSAKNDKNDGNVVIVTILGMKLIGLITRDKFDDLPPGIGNEGEVAVYIPMSYQLGGFTVIVPRSTIKPIADMTTEKGLRFAVTAGMQTTKENRDETQ